jgi:hypothetical protein
MSARHIDETFVEVADGNEDIVALVAGSTPDQALIECFSGPVFVCEIDEYGTGRREPGSPPSGSFEEDDVLFGLIGDQFV